MMMRRLVSPVATAVVAILLFGQPSLPNVVHAAHRLKSNSGKVGRTPMVGRQRVSGNFKFTATSVKRKDGRPVDFDKDFIVRNDYAADCTDADFRKFSKKLKSSLDPFSIVEEFMGINSVISKTAYEWETPNRAKGCLLSTTVVEAVGQLQATMHPKTNEITLHFDECEIQQRLTHFDGSSDFFGDAKTKHVLPSSVILAPCHYKEILADPTADWSSDCMSTATYMTDGGEGGITDGALPPAEESSSGSFNRRSFLKTSTRRCTKPLSAYIKSDDDDDATDTSSASSRSRSSDRPTTSSSSSSRNSSSVKAVERRPVQIINGEDDYDDYEDQVTQLRSDKRRGGRGSEMSSSTVSRDSWSSVGSRTSTHLSTISRSPSVESSSPASSSPSIRSGSQDSALSRRMRSRSGREDPNPKSGDNESDENGSSDDSTASLSSSRLGGLSRVGTKRRRSSSAATPSASSDPSVRRTSSVVLSDAASYVGPSSNRGTFKRNISKNGSRRLKRPEIATASFRAAVNEPIFEAEMEEAKGDDEDVSPKRARS